MNSDYITSSGKYFIYNMNESKQYMKCDLINIHNEVLVANPFIIS